MRWFPSYYNLRILSLRHPHPTSHTLYTLSSGISVHLALITTSLRYVPAVTPYSPPFLALIAIVSAQCFLLTRDSRAIAFMSLHFMICHDPRYALPPFCPIILPLPRTVPALAPQSVSRVSSSSNCVCCASLIDPFRIGVQLFSQYARLALCEQ